MVKKVLLNNDLNQKEKKKIETFSTMNNKKESARRESYIMSYRISYTSNLAPQ
jgi:hypothetical protein